MAQRGRAVPSYAFVTTVSGVVARNAAQRPDAIAFGEAASGRSITWKQYDERARDVAAALAAGYERGDRLALQIPDGPDVHIAMLACELAGVVGVGIGTRAGARETTHIIE